MGSSRTHVSVTMLLPGHTHFSTHLDARMPAGRTKNSATTVRCCTFRPSVSGFRHQLTGSLVYGGSTDAPSELPPNSTPQEERWTRRCPAGGTDQLPAKKAFSGNLALASVVLTVSKRPHVVVRLAEVGNQATFNRRRVANWCPQNAEQVAARKPAQVFSAGMIGS